MRVYTIELPLNSSLTAAITTLVEATVKTTGIMYLLGAWCSQKLNTTSAMQDIQLVRKTAAGTNVISPVANQEDPGDAAFGGTVRGMCTVEGTLGAQIYADSFNWANGWVWAPKYKEEWVISNTPNNLIVALRLPTVPAAFASGVNAGITVGEVG